MQTKTKKIALTLGSVSIVVTGVVVGVQLFIAGHAAASDGQAYLDRIAKAYNASTVKLIDNKWNNRTDVEMIVGKMGYDCLLPTEEQLEHSLPLKCTSFPYVSTFA